MPEVLTIIMLYAAGIFILFCCVLSCLPPAKPRPRRRHCLPYRKWRGPKTDVRINQMFAECIELMHEIGCPISESICPEVVIIGNRSVFGRCCPKGSFDEYTEYDFYIEISGHTLHNTEKSLRNTLIHELVHTVPGGNMGHRGEWKKWAKYVSEKTGYNIGYYTGDDTPEDRHNLCYGE